MEITGRLTADAKLNTLQDERQVVSFTLVQNDNFKTKGGEKKQVATYFDCSYWISPKVADKLKKGTIVLLYGRIGINAWNNMQGEANASLTFHTNNIKFIGGGKSNAASTEQQEEGQTDVIPTPETKDDLPF